MKIMYALVWCAVCILCWVQDELAVALWGPQGDFYTT